MTSSSDAERLIQITAPHFVAGIVALDGRVVEAAPILRYMAGWTGQEMVACCRRKGWTWEQATTPNERKSEA